ncbi:MAG: hypothetical protein DCC75_13905 [Proteobacteria bacterium]|nr:MAG: hypothetical protein DCC75_13905 [Pseudomonadota bacterium]
MHWQLRAITYRDLLIFLKRIGQGLCEILMRVLRELYLVTLQNMVEVGSGPEGTLQSFFLERRISRSTFSIPYCNQ